jgi:hypothetical protein
LDISDSKDVAYKYSISKENKNKPTYSGEINLAEEHIDEEDKIILYIHNIAANGTGFGQTFVYDDFGWKNGPVGGFSFVKITKSGFSEFFSCSKFLDIPSVTNLVSLVTFGGISYLLVLVQCSMPSKMGKIQLLVLACICLHFAIW